MLRLLALATLCPLVSWGAVYDFDYRSVGDPDARPTNIFDDGNSTYFQFAAGRPVPAILKVGPAGERLSTWREDGPYVVVDEVLPDWRMRLGRGIAAVRYAGTRPLAVKGVLYGAAVPISEGGSAALRRPAPVATMTSQSPAPTAAPAAPALSLAQGIARPASAVPPAIPPISHGGPAQSLPDFSGGFVVQMGSAGILQSPRAAPETAPEAAATPSLKLAVAMRISRRVSERLSVRFTDLSPSATDQVMLDTAVSQAKGMSAGYIVVRAYSGAKSLKSRQRYAALRADEVKSALVRAGVDAARIRVVTATTRTASRADILFIGEGVRA
jgi:hypothetical protein